jgi:hypothetical protein
MKKYNLLISFCLLTVFIISCAKQESLSPKAPEEPKLLFVNFIEDSVAVKLPVTSAREESIGNVFTTAIEGKLPDSVLKRNNLIIRVTDDSARAYVNTEILASYTDSAGFTYSTNTADTINKVTITKIEKKKDGSVEGSFTIRVSNSTKTKTLMLKEGKFSTVFPE